MSAVLSALIWLADAINKLAQLGWWFVPVLAPGATAGLWLWLRPTGKHRLPRTSRPAEPEPVQAVSSPAPAASKVGVGDTLMFQKVAPTRGEANG